MNAIKRYIPITFMSNINSKRIEFFKKSTKKRPQENDEAIRKQEIQEN